MRPHRGLCRLLSLAPWVLGCPTGALASPAGAAGAVSAKALSESDGAVEGAAARSPTAGTTPSPTNETLPNVARGATSKVLATVTAPAPARPHIDLDASEAKGTTLATAASTPPNAASRRAFRALRIEAGSVDVDGEARESVWQRADFYGAFVQRDPYDGAAPTEQTEVAFAYDESALYVFVRAHDRQAERIQAQLSRRDEVTPSDWIEVWLDPQNDRRTAYRFAVNARGVQLDARFSEGGQVQDVAWNAAWESATRLTETGWNAELRIPFAELRYDRSVESWGVQVSRRLQRENEESGLAPIPRTALRPLHFLARLENLKELPRPRWFSLTPYVVGGYERSPELREPVVRGGGTLAFRLGASSNWQISVLPDFAQVEADPSVLNLSAFEVFFPERRQFFLDGQETFQLPLAHRNWLNETLFYSRRIGARPGRDLGLEDDEILRYPRTTTLWGASKLVGRTRSGLSYGALQAITGAERALVEVDGVRSEPLVASPTSYTVGRLRQEFDGGRSAVGVMGTQVVRSLDPSVRGEFVERATAVAADFDWRQGDVALLGHVVGTHLSGSPEAIDAVQRSSTHFYQRPDAEHLHYDPRRTSLTGWGAELVGGKLQGLPWRTGWAVRARSPGLNPNDLGYLQRADEQHAEVWAQRLEADPTWLYRLFSMDGALWLTKTFGAEVTGWGASLNASMQLKNNMNAWLGGLRRQAALDPSLLRGGPAFMLPGGWEGWWGFYSDERRRWQVGADGNLWLRDGGILRKTRTKLHFGVRPSDSLQLSLAPSYEQNFDELQYVEEVEGEIVLGDLASRAVYLTLRAAWAIALGLTLEVYAMPYVTAGTYERFRAVADPRARAYSERLRPTDYDGDSGFLFAQLRSNVVLRYDYFPGASAYLVWTREQTDSRDTAMALRPEHRLAPLLRTQPADVLLFKLEHRFVP